MDVDGFLDGVAVVFVLRIGFCSRSCSGGEGEGDVCATERIVDRGDVLGGVGWVETEGEEDGTGSDSAGWLDDLGGCDGRRSAGISERW